MVIGPRVEGRKDLKRVWWWFFECMCMEIWSRRRRVVGEPVNFTFTFRARWDVRAT